MAFDLGIKACGAANSSDCERLAARGEDEAAQLGGRPCLTQTVEAAKEPNDEGGGELLY